MKTHHVTLFYTSKCPLTTQKHCFYNLYLHFTVKKKKKRIKTKTKEQNWDRKRQRNKSIPSPPLLSRSAATVALSLQRTPCLLQRKSLNNPFCLSKVSSLPAFLICFQEASSLQFLIYFLNKPQVYISGCHVGYVNDDYETLNGFECQVFSQLGCYLFIYSHDS